VDKKGSHGAVEGGGELFSRTQGGRKPVFATKKYKGEGNSIYRKKEGGRHRAEREAEERGEHPRGHQDKSRRVHARLEKVGSSRRQALGEKPARKHGSKGSDPARASKIDQGIDGSGEGSVFPGRGDEKEKK